MATETQAKKAHMEFTREISFTPDQQKEQITILEQHLKMLLESTVFSIEYKTQHMRLALDLLEKFRRRDGEGLAESVYRTYTDVVINLGKVPKSDDIFAYFAAIPNEITLIYVKDLRMKFSDAEIRKLTWECPKGWDHSAPSSGQMTNYSWVDKNFDAMIRMGNGGIAYYFYRVKT